MNIFGKRILSTALTVTFMTTLVVTGVKAQEQITFENGFVVEEKREGKPVILDMDFGSDADDACALRVAGALHLRGDIELKAITSSVLGENDINLKAINGLLESQSLNGIPIGRSTVQIYDTSPYWETLANCSTTQYEVWDSVKLWRKIISESDRPVDICTTGYLGNLAEFCKSQPDEISNKTGLELLNTKVGNVYITGGTWTTGIDNNFSFYQESRESMAWLMENVDKSFFFITNEVGGPFLCGGEITNLDKDDPLSKALLAWGTDCGRAAWDPMAMYICAIGNSEEILNNNNLLKMNIDVTYDESTGKNQFTENIDGKHCRIYRASDNLEIYRQILDDLCTIRNKEEASRFMREG